MKKERDDAHEVLDEPTIAALLARLARVAYSVEIYIASRQSDLKQLATLVGYEGTMEVRARYHRGLVECEARLAEFEAEIAAILDTLAKSGGLTIARCAAVLDRLVEPPEEPTIAQRAAVLDRLAKFGKFTSAERAALFVKIAEEYWDKHAQLVAYLERQARDREREAAGDPFFGNGLGSVRAVISLYKRRQVGREVE